MLLLTCAVVPAQTVVYDALPLSPKALMPAGPVWSGDRSVAVRSSVAMENYRAPVLFFVNNAREEFLRAMRLRMPPQGFLLEVIIGNQRDGDTRVLSARVRASGGEGMCERIELPDPEAADLVSLKRCVGMALYRSWLVSRSGGETVLKHLPPWLVEGAVRRMDAEAWPADVDRTLLLWSHACLPTAKDLFCAESPAVAAEPAVGAVLADYLMSKRVSANVMAAVAADSPADKKGVGGTVLDALTRDASDGRVWSVAGLAGLVTGEEDGVALDRDFDCWLSGMGRKVLVPGMTTEGTLRRFRASLLIYPSDYGKFFNQREPFWTFQEFMRVAADSPEMRKAAAAHVLKVQMAAVGRDGTLLALAEAYSRFLKAVAAKKKPAEVSLLLVKAEAQRKGLEDALKGGKVLRD